MKSLRHEYGGAPLWALFASLLLTIGLVIGTAAAAGSPRGTPEFIPPTGAPTPSLPAPMPFAVFLGDGYTQGLGGGGITWPELVGDPRGWDVLNLGLGGTGYISTSGEAGCGRVVCGNYLEASSEILGTPRYIFVSGGRADLGLPVAEVATAADTLLATLRTRYPAAEIFVINPWFDDDPPPASPDEFVAALRAAAEGNDAVFLDTGQPLFDRPDLISPDGIHPNGDGYVALAAAVQAALSTIIQP